MALLFELTQKLAQGFMAFYSRYPRKEAKKDAEKAWSQLAPSPELEQEIHKALDWQVPLMLERPPQYRPLPASWLRGERWEDEQPEQPAPPKPKTAPVVVTRFAEMGMHTKPHTPSPEWLARMAQQREEEGQ